MEGIVRYRLALGGDEGFRGCALGRGGFRVDV